MIKNPSKYQQDIFSTYRETSNNMVINACPGSGKTTTIIELIRQTPKSKSILLSAFNKSIQEELSHKITQSNLTISTIHALGYSFLRAYMVDSKFKLNEYKNWIFLKKVVDEKLFKKTKDYNVYLAILSNFINLLKMNDALSDPSKMERVIEGWGFVFLGNEINHASEAITLINNYNKANHRGKEFMIDFTDMLYLTYKMVPEKYYKKYDVVFVDESQDLNTIQKSFIEKSIKPGGRFVAVGDDKQAIYGFMGSTLESFNELKSKPNTIEKPLSVCYRCDKSIVREAQGVFNDIEEFESKPEGIVRQGSLQDVEKGDFVICRNNLPLVEAFVVLVSRELPVKILGKDFGASLLSLLRKMNQSEDLPKQFISDTLEDMYKKLKEAGVQNPTKNQKYQSLEEKFSIIDILKDKFGSYNEVYNKIETIFTDIKDTDPDVVTLSTIHKAKGLESNRVFIIGFKELIPSQYASTQNELYGERCLAYVAITRAKHELIYIPYSI